MSRFLTIDFKHKQFVIYQHPKLLAVPSVLYADKALLHASLLNTAYNICFFILKKMSLQSHRLANICQQFLSSVIQLCTERAFSKTSFRFNLLSEDV